MPTGQWLASNLNDWWGIANYIYDDWVNMPANYIGRDHDYYITPRDKYHKKRICKDEAFEVTSIELDKNNLTYTTMDCIYCRNELRIDIDIKWFYICKHCLSWLKFDTPKLAETNEAQSSSSETKEKRID